MVADRSTLSQLSLRTTYVYDIKSGSRLVPWTTGKQDLKMFTSTVTYPVSKFQSGDATHSPKRGCSALTCPHWAHKKANARAIVTEVFSLSDCTHTVCKKEKWQFEIKCETYCGAWLPCMHQRVYKGVSWPGSISKFIQCSTSLASHLASSACKEHSAELTVHMLDD